MDEFDSSHAVCCILEKLQCKVRYFPASIAKHLPKNFNEKEAIVIKVLSPAENAETCHLCHKNGCLAFCQLT